MMLEGEDESTVKEVTCLFWSNAFEHMLKGHEGLESISWSFQIVAEQDIQVSKIFMNKKMEIVELSIHMMQLISFLFESFLAHKQSVQSIFTIISNWFIYSTF